MLTRLLASYIAMLLILLLLIGIVLVVFLYTRPLPTDDITNELTATLLDVRVIDRIFFEIRTPAQGQGQGGQGQDQGPAQSVIQGNFVQLLENDGTLAQHVVEFLVTEARTREIRLLLVTNAGRVLFDTEQTMLRGHQIHEQERTSLIADAPPGAPPVVVFKGRFDDPNGEEWLYVAQPVLPQTRVQPETVFLMVAEPAPQQSLSEVFRVFGDTFFLPLAQAGVSGLVIAAMLSVLVSSSVARPLQRISHAAQRIASGDYRQRVPVQGPKEVRTLAQTFNYMAGRVATSQQAQHDFLANVSHDLRTPLTSIQGFSQAIMEGVASDPESAQRAAQVIYDEAGRLHRMVESLLDLARVEADKLNMHQHAVALTDLLQGVGTNLAFKAQPQGVRLVVNVPPDLPRIPGNGNRLAQVFPNLIDNAIKHTPEDGQISLSSAASTGGIPLMVQDTGVGIPAENLPRIFER
ncbi:MAG: HAMP domain-containing histidine kinase, partial [Anaerolineae bacterium]|nr:HAMP domain-containing histidine kinase [Anaerolineae bacterium]